MRKNVPPLSLCCILFLAMLIGLNNQRSPSSEPQTKPLQEEVRPFTPGGTREMVTLPPRGVTHAMDVSGDTVVVVDTAKLPAGDFNSARWSAKKGEKLSGPLELPYSLMSLVDQAVDLITQLDSTNRTVGLCVPGLTLEADIATCLLKAVLGNRNNQSISRHWPEESDVNTNRRAVLVASSHSGDSST